MTFQLTCGNCGGELPAEQARRFAHFIECRGATTVWCPFCAERLLVPPNTSAFSAIDEHLPQCAAWLERAAGGDVTLPTAGEQRDAGRDPLDVLFMAGAELHQFAAEMAKKLRQVGIPYTPVLARHLTAALLDPLRDGLEPPKQPDNERPLVHVLQHGRTLCNRRPSGAHDDILAEGDKWVRIEEAGEATCPECLRVMSAAYKL